MYICICTHYWQQNRFSVECANCACAPIGMSVFDQIYVYVFTNNESLILVATNNIEVLWYTYIAVCLEETLVLNTCNKIFFSYQALNCEVAVSIKMFKQEVPHEKIKLSNIFFIKVTFDLLEWINWFVVFFSGWAISNINLILLCCPDILKAWWGWICENEFEVLENIIK